MPQDPNNPTGSQLATAAPEGFQSMDDYDASLMADHGKLEEPPDFFAPEETAETPAETAEAYNLRFQKELAEKTEETPTEEPATEAEGAEAPAADVFEVNGQEFTSDQIIEALTNQEQSAGVLEEFQSLREQYEGAEGEMQSLKPYRELKNFFEKNPDIRRKFEAEIGEFEKLAQGNISNDPHVAALQKQNQELMTWKREVEVSQANSQIDRVFDKLQSDYPDIVDEDFRSSVLNQVYGAFKGDPRFGVKTLAAAAKTTAYLMEKATAKASASGQAAALRAVRKPGVVRLVPAGKRSDAQPKAKDYKSMTPAQLEDAFVDEVNVG